MPTLHPIPFYSSLLEAASTTKSLTKLKPLHARVIILGIAYHDFIRAKLVSSYANCGAIREAHHIFSRTNKQTTFLYNTLIRTYTSLNHFQSALNCYWEMRNSGKKPDIFTFPAVLKACAGLAALQLARQLHLAVTAVGFSSDATVGNALVSVYSKCGDLSGARQVFDEMPERNVVSWSAMIAGYSRVNMFKQALELFQDMLESKTIPNESTLVSVLSACANLGALAQGQWLHSFMERNRYKPNVRLGTALADMYGKCGCVELALDVFDKIPRKDVGSWNAIISGLAMNGDAEGAIGLLSRMQGDGVRPNAVTFISVLSACAHGGFVRDGLRLFESMRSVYGIEPRVEHYACVVDLLGRAGFLEEAEKLVEMGKMVVDLNVWGALLGACRIHGNVEVGDRIGKKLIELGLADCGTYVLLYNIYSEAGWDREAERVRKLITEERLKKKPGCSSIEVNGIVYEFLAGDLSDPQWRETREILDSLSRVLKLR